MSEIVDATGPAAATRFKRAEMGSALYLGVFSLLVGGLYPLLLAALAREGALTGPEIGLTATLETLATGVAAGLAGARLPARRLPWIGVAAALLLGAANLATAYVSHGALVAARAAAGLPEGLLLWLAISLIARTATPERGAGLMALGQPISQFAFAAALGALVLPAFGSRGAFLVLAVAAVLSAPAALWLPRRLGPVATVGAAKGPLPARGWIVLFGTTASVAAFTASAVYLGPLAALAGHGADVVSLAVACALAAEVLGAGLATGIAGRVRPLLILTGCGAAAVVGWGVLATSPSAPLFVAAAAGLGFAAFLASPFLVAYAIEVEPSRRAALQSGAAQLLGAALGPLAASRIVVGSEVRPALALAAGLMVVGTARAWRSADGGEGPPCEQRIRSRQTRPQLYWVGRETAWRPPLSPAPPGTPRSSAARASAPGG